MRSGMSSIDPLARRFGPYSRAQRAYLKEQLHQYIRTVPIPNAHRTLTSAAAFLNPRPAAPKVPRPRGHDHCRAASVAGTGGANYLN